MAPTAPALGRDVSAGAELDDVYFPAGEGRSASYTSSWPAVNAFLACGNLSRHFARQRATAGFITGGTVLRLELRDAFLPSGSVLLAFRAGIVS